MTYKAEPGTCALCAPVKKPSKKKPIVFLIPDVFCEPLCGKHLAVMINAKPEVDLEERWGLTKEEKETFGPFPADHPLAAAHRV